MLLVIGTVVFGIAGHLSLKDTLIKNTLQAPPYKDKYCGINRTAVLIIGARTTSIFNFHFCKLKFIKTCGKLFGFSDYVNIV